MVIVNDLFFSRVFPNLEVPIHAHVDQLVSNTCKSAIYHVYVPLFDSYFA